MTICLKGRRRLTLRSARILIVCSWLISICISLFPIFFWGKYHFTEKGTLCKPRDGHFTLFLGIACFCIPLSVMVFCYVNVFLKVHRHKQNITQSQTEGRRFIAELQTTKIVFVMLAVFIALWAPYTIALVYSNYTNSDMVPIRVFKFFGFLTALHSSCNSVIYFTMIRSFRKTAVNLMRRIWPCLFSASADPDTTINSLDFDKVNSAPKISTIQANKTVLLDYTRTNGGASADLLAEING